MNRQIPVNPPWGIFEIILILLFVNLFGLGYGTFFGESLLAMITRLFPFIPDNLITFFFFASALQALIFVGGSLLIVVGHYKGSFSDLGLNFDKLKEFFSWGFIGGLIVFSLVIGVSTVVNYFSPSTPEPQPVAELLMGIDSFGELILPFIMVVVFAPLGEEIFFRGFIYPVFRKRLGITMALVVTGMIFALLHFDLIRFIPLAIGGIFLAWLYEKTGSIITPIIAHATWNGVMTILMIMTVN